MRRFLYRLADHWCWECGGFMWPWQVRCGNSHRRCQHTRSMRAYLSIERNDPTNGYMVPPWDCSWCGRPITEDARP